MGRQPLPVSRISNNSDWQLALRVFRHLSGLWVAHSIDRFASFANKQLSRNTKWRDGASEAVDFFAHDGQKLEGNLCKPPWGLLNDLAAKLRISGAEASVITPY